MPDYAVWTTVIISLIIGVSVGYVMHRSGFCLAGMVRDLFLFRSMFMLRILALLVLANMVLTEILRLTGWLPLFPYPGFGPPALTNLLGGAVFGVGMVLAGGCVAGTLYKMGSGNLVSLCAFFGLLTGSTLYAEFYGFCKLFSAATQLAPGKVTLAQLFDIQQSIVVLLAGLLISLWLLKCYRSGSLIRRSYAEGFLQPWKAALIIAVLTAVSSVVLGMPLGITTSFAKTGSWLASIFFPEYINSLDYFSVQPIRFKNALLGNLCQGGPGPKPDGISLVQAPLIVGLIAGGFISSVALSEFKIYWRTPLLQLLSGLVGGVLMGFAARMAPSCNIWHMLGGLPILALQSLLFCIGLLPGAWLGGVLVSRLVLRGSE